jgi:guanylate kinase
MKEPKLFVISAPSGGGKTSIVKVILGRHPEFVFSVSATTRPKRSNETTGKDYFFLAREEFERMIAENALVEYEEIYGQYYGTLKREVDRALHAGRSMLFDVDVKGSLSIKKLYGTGAILIFIQPPSMQVLEERLRNRNTENDDAFRRRMARVAMEMETGQSFDFRVVNDSLQQAIDEVDTIIKKHIR